MNLPALRRKFCFFVCKLAPVHAAIFLVSYVPLEAEAGRYAFKGSLKLLLSRFDRADRIVQSDVQQGAPLLRLIDAPWRNPSR